MFQVLEIPIINLKIQMFILLNILSAIVFGHIIARRSNKMSVACLCTMCYVGAYTVGAYLLSKIYEHGFNLYSIDYTMNWPIYKTFMGGTLLFVVALLLTSWIFRFKCDYLDDVCIAWSFSQSISSLACFCDGCCQGIITSSILGLPDPSAVFFSIKRVPLALIESALLVSSGCFLLFLASKKLFKCWFITILGSFYCTVYPLLDIFRAKGQSYFLGGPLSLAQIISIAIAVFCDVLLVLKFIHASSMDKQRRFE